MPVWNSVEPVSSDEDEDVPLVTLVMSSYSSTTLGAPSHDASCGAVRSGMPAASVVNEVRPVYACHCESESFWTLIFHQYCVFQVRAVPA